jgi:hypothetical protein
MKRNQIKGQVLFKREIIAARCVVKHKCPGE